MKKLFAMFLAVAAMASVKAEDSYLYWMISPTAPAFSYASLYVDKGGGTVVALDEFLTGVDEGSTQTSLAALTTKVDASNLGLGYNYYVELMNADGEATFVSGMLGYLTIDDYIYQKPNLPPAAINMGQGGFTAVPEPTSGVMMLMGLVLLGLKRKRA